MPQVFRRSANSLAKVSVVGAVVLLGCVILAAYALNDSSFTTDVGVHRSQPVPFSHKHHVTDDGIDCRYCHTSVETSSFAGIPPTETCMSCHSQLFTTSDILEPVRASYQTGQSLAWTRVHDLPDFVYFNHSIHINKGIGCSTCHGRVDLMPLTYKENTLYMGWCLDCHRAPEANIRPRAEIYNMEWVPTEQQLRQYGAASQEELGRRLVAEYKVQKLTDCYTCHR